MHNVLDLRKAFNTPNIIESICNWNAARYEQVHNMDLTLDLLEEEWDQEAVPAYQANDVVEICDANADIFYVAIGAIWKHGLDADTIAKLMDKVEADMPSLPPIPVGIMWFSTEGHLEALAMVALRAVQDLQDILGSEDAALDIIRAVCKSNDSKLAVKTDPDTKANIDKGASYKAPTEDIKKILNIVQKGGYNAQYH